MTTTNKVTRIKNRTKLRNVLYHERHDKIVIYTDGRWSAMSSNTIAQGDVLTEINHVTFYDVSHQDVDTKVKEIELYLNGRGKEYDGRNRRENIQNDWRTHIKGR